jgi:hypothetical protein
VPTIAADLRFLVGAGEGNRTPTISLGICSIQASKLPDLRGGLSLSDRERPLLTPINGTLMARRQVIISSVGHPLGYPGFSGVARVCPRGRSE